MNTALLLSAPEWAQATFGEVRLGDQRRTKRVVRMATLMATQSDVSLPRMMKSKADLKAAYRLLETPDVTYEALIHPHMQQTQQQAGSRRRVLLIQDTTDLNYSHHPTTTGLGPLKNQKQHGILLQTVLAVDAQERQVLGIMHQEPFLRKLAPEQETRAQRLKRERESQVWERSVTHIGPPPEGVEWIHVGDRGSDIFTFFEACLAQGTHFVVRAAQDRRVQCEEETEQIGRLFDSIRAQPCCQKKVIDIPASADRPARSATLSLAWQPVSIQPPQRGASTTGQPVAAWVVRAWEENPVEGEEPLEWILLTSVPIQTVEQAWERVEWYRARWIVEDYHQGLKTGCCIEERQLQTYEGVRRLLGLLSPMAVRLLQLRAASRLTPELPASQTMPDEVVRVVAYLAKVPAAELTTQQCWYTIAGQGGYLGRPGDGPPGWKTLWYGWFHLQTLLQGIHLASLFAFQ
jgi:Transposase DNA-binding/Transposase Tn5 dimerisation domain